MAEVIGIKRKSNVRFTTVVHKSKKGAIKGEMRGFALIVLKDYYTDVEVVHPISAFIWDNYKNNRVKTQVDYSGRICTFLNFVLDNIRAFKISNISELQFCHAKDFLEYLVDKGDSRNTIKSYKKILNKFYLYLTKKEILRYCTIEDFSIDIFQNENNGKTVEKIITELEDVLLPENRAKLSISHDLSLELQMILINTAINEVNIIALGIVMQIAGGLRHSEVINLTYSSISDIGGNGKFGLLTILKRRDLSGKEQNSGRGGVKKERTQKIDGFAGLLKFTYENHMKTYRKNSKCDAVFVNKKGNPMSSSMYRYYFNKLKQKFIDRLSNNENCELKMYALMLQEKKWSTHISRGIFSNNLVAQNKSITEIARARGDKCLSSSITYVGDSIRTSEMVSKNTDDTFNKLYKKYFGDMLGYEGNSK